MYEEISNQYCGNCGLIGRLPAWMYRYDGCTSISSGNYGKPLKKILNECCPFWRPVTPIKNTESEEFRKMSFTVKRAEVQEVGGFKAGDIIAFLLKNGEKVEAMAMEADDNGALFITVNCLKERRRLWDDTPCPGYEATELRKWLNSDLVANFPDEIKKQMIAFGSGDYLRLPTEKEIFGTNEYGENELESVKQFEPMKDRRNRIADYGCEHDGECAWWWTQTQCRDSATAFACVDNYGNAGSNSASNSLGVRPAFYIRNHAA